MASTVRAEPIPVPSGYGFVLGANSTNVTHVYESKTLLGHEKAAEKAQVEVLDYYVERLQELGWSVVPPVDGVVLRAPDSDVGIRVHTFVGIPTVGRRQGNRHPRTHRQTVYRRDQLPPASINDVEPYNG